MSSKIELSPEQKEVLESDGPLLVTGGPGSGKTTVSILKAANLAATKLSPFQRILFLSFARSTISRVIEAIDESEAIDSRHRELIEVETYHALFWRLIRSQGVLLNLPRKLNLLTPQAEAVALSAIRNAHGADRNLPKSQLAAKKSALQQERLRLAFETGEVCFDLFAKFSADLFEKSEKIRAWFHTRYPVIIVDEFQDTNLDQWRFIKSLKQRCQVIALADPEQRIFDFVGADPERLNQFREEFSPRDIELKGANYRSSGTDIALLGNDVLAGRFTKSRYEGVDLKTFPNNKQQAYATLGGEVLRARSRQIKSGKLDWSVAILVPTKAMTRKVCDVLASPQGKLPAVQHTAVLDVDGILLAAELVAYCMERSELQAEPRFVELICRFLRGRGGNQPSETNLKAAASLEASYSKFLEKRAQGKSMPASSLIMKALSDYQRIRSIRFVGNVMEDWIAVRVELEKAKLKTLQEIAAEVRNLRLLMRGADLRTAMGQIWREFGDYRGALEAVRGAFVRDHFVSAKTPETGVIIMNMHKSKGKQFDEVIIFEGWPSSHKGVLIEGSNQNRIVRRNDPHSDLSAARLTLRVGITRAKQRVTFLTPEIDPCVLLRTSG